MLDLENLPIYLDYFCNSRVFSPEQLALIQSSLLVAKHQMHLSRMIFWGRIYGTQADYFIAQGIVKTDTNPWYTRRTVVSQDCMHWALLNPPTENLKKWAQMTSMKRFTGVLSNVIDIPKPPSEDDPLEDGAQGSADNVKGGSTYKASGSTHESAAGDGGPAIPKKIKEEDRLIGIIAAIDDGTYLVPRSAFMRDQAGHVFENKAFEGLQGDEAGKLCNYFHLRPATHLFTKTLLERGDMEPSLDFLDTALDELPTAPGSTWSIQYERGGSHVVLRSLLWPGYSFFHVPGSRRYGSLYSGVGTYNVDFPFMN